MLYGHGDDGFRYGDIRLDFSSNLFYSGLSDKVVTNLSGQIRSVGNYPEPCAAPVRSLLAKEHNLIDRNIVVTNGATEAFYLIAQLLKNKKSLIFTPTFAEYEDACRVNEHELQFKDWSTINEPISEKVDVVWICNPNNPTGAVITHDNIKAKLEAHPDIVFVIDEAYMALCSEQESVVSLVNEYKNLIVVHSLTKCCCIPGLRLGYLISNTDAIQQIENIKMPWSVNSLAIAAGLFVIPQRKSLLLGLKHLLRNATNFAAMINEVEQLEALPTHTNFVLAKTNVGKAADLKEFLVEKYGFLIRNADNFRGLDEGYFRVCVKTKKENIELVDAIKAWLNTLS
ncbi:aminotransferase class I/II-fold pyridoxal phosphate-dependent enzyme [Prolixibacteraceae bacterium JC049]|nr:aminotransferase class I/II-fold pyridoxal phosphate-dependent enzyme [Prolixibacteraceae bacterium JC049]